MKNRYKNKLICILITVIISSFTIPITNITANAADINSKDIDLVILFDDNSIDKNVEKIITNSGGKIVEEFPELGGIEVKCSSDLIPVIKSEDSVKSLAPNHVIKLSNEKTIKFEKLNNNSNNVSDDLYESYQWDIKRVTNNGNSFNLESGNHDVIVGIIDSGVDTTHPDLINNFLGGENLVPPNFKDDSSETGDSDDVADRLGHGTNIAGIIAANGRIKGVAPNIGFKSYRIFNKNEETTATIVSSAIIKATDDHVKVINLSIEGYDLKGKCYWTNPSTRIKYDLGNDTAEYSLYKRAIQYAIKNGVTVVSAAGNQGLNCSNKKKLTEYLNDKYSNEGFKYTGITYEVPGSIQGVITVSATSKNDKVASYSNYGEDFIDISAPGGDFSNINEEDSLCLTTAIDGEYTFTAGTSIAAPKVSAVAALIICQHKGISPKLVERKICGTADTLGVDSLSKYYGDGMVNAYNAIQ
ncbi:S8 family peptidase [Clostridium saccharobutylicum]|uniref:Thermophilic serine proteinase n=1 Tax=Clostridium saccharobutylicum TaxID=169679 RepID=A0A1S8NJW0_CLOSA|nr:S8 family serine peptidase [Clostridium saccharobutylicum]OOM16708.1 thermophilic serine proteinase precursor [Clostridium saccharobutylicum]